MAAESLIALSAALVARLNWIAPPLSVTPEVLFKAWLMFPDVDVVASVRPALTVVVPDHPFAEIPLKVSVWFVAGFCAVKVMFALLAASAPLMMALVTLLLRATVLLVPPKVREFAPVLMVYPEALKMRPPAVMSPVSDTVPGVGPGMAVPI